MMGKRKISIILVITLVISILSSAFMITPFIRIGSANPGNDSHEWDNTTTLNVTVEQLEPRINWFDFQFNNSGTWESRLNQQIDVDNVNEYRFVVNMSSDQGWDDIEYIWINAWTDLGDDASTYNSSTGGNKNLNISYTNTTGTASWKLEWPDDEASLVSVDCTEWNETDTDGIPNQTACVNVTFAFIPSYQFRYAPGDGAWNTAAGFNDLWSWNFNITSLDSNGNYSYFNPTKNDSLSEFGIYTYTEIMTIEWPTITGNPGTTEIADSNISVNARSNGNYSLSIDLDELQHNTNPGASIANTTVSLRGGDVESPQTYSGSAPIYLFGTSAPTYRYAYNDTTSFTTSDIEFRMAIPLAQTPGEYTGVLRYHLTTEE